MSDPFAGKTEISAEEYRAFVDGRYPDFPPIEETAPAWQTSETAFQAKVVKYATEHGWMSYHTWKSANSSPGFPDLVMIRGDRIVVAELKVGTNKVTKDQRAWLDAFDGAGIIPHVWRPDDVEFIEEVLA
jgi:hypothetical protein